MTGHSTAQMENIKTCETYTTLQTSASKNSGINWETMFDHLYQKISLNRLKRLKQRDRTVMAYYRKFKSILSCYDLDESDEATEIHFLNDLNKKI